MILTVKDILDSVLNREDIECELYSYDSEVVICVGDIDEILDDNEYCDCEVCKTEIYYLEKRDKILLVLDIYIDD